METAALKQSIEKIKVAQDAARETMLELHSLVRPGMSEKQIESLALEGLVRRGSDSWWYHGVGALVLLGERSCVSTSGLEYYASETNILSDTDVITIDLAPTIGGYWGDHARTIFMENGKAAPPDAPTLPAFQDGLRAEQHLHALLLQIVRPDSTYAEIFYRINEEIERIGFINLDYRKTLGHTIEFLEQDRIYIEGDVRSTFAELGKPFTFEPHIAKRGGDRGFKREDIYYFEGSTLRRL
ncbi:MAG: M24 family metallopeptidase [Oscillospiraceae bacterium]|nr:M24 family metallopeptidase [Oscillospiraceae bacterium]